MKIQSNHPELDEILNRIWEGFSPTEGTTLPEALTLCFARVRELEAREEQQRIADAAFRREDDGMIPPDAAAGEDPEECNCLLCQVKRKLKENSLKN